MEVFIEQMVKRKKAPTDYVMAAVIYFLAAVVAYIMVFVLMPMLSPFSILGTLVFFLAAGVIYGAYILVGSTNVEYEYSLVNTEIDIDKIMNKNKRKRMTTASIRGLEAFGTKKNPDFNRYLSNSAVLKMFACRDRAEEDLFFIVYNQGDKKIMLVFNPNEKMIEQITKRNPRTPLV